MDKSNRTVEYTFDHAPGMGERWPSLSYFASASLLAMVSCMEATDCLAAQSSPCRCNCKNLLKNV